FSLLDLCERNVLVLRFSQKITQLGFAVLNHGELLRSTVHIIFSTTIGIVLGRKEKRVWLHPLICITG
ncbi:MAG TPA: hypothetical protein PLE74_11315, partial [Candidatus Cloacimonadota bacterium]|nr:hypothetical protein [Candidatus Cloacimonadota bacterium]